MNPPSSESDIMCEEDRSAPAGSQLCNSACRGIGDDVNSESRTLSGYWSRMVGGVDEMDEGACEASEKVAPSDVEEAQDSG